MLKIVLMLLRLLNPWLNPIHFLGSSLELAASGELNLGQIVE
jgi:hypothetical protein